MLFLFDRYVPRVPGALVVLVGGIAASRILQLHQHGVDIVGAIPAGLPHPGLPMLTWTDWLQAAPAAVGLVLVLFAESMGAARTFAGKNGYDVDPNQELRALGFANIVSGIFRGMQVGGGTSGTAANDSNGARTEVSSIAASATVILVLLFLTGWFYHLPEAVLAAIVIHAVWHLLDYRTLSHFRQVSRLEYRESVAAIIGVLAFDILERPRAGRDSQLDRANALSLYAASCGCRAVCATPESTSTSSAIPRPNSFPEFSCCVSIASGSSPMLTAFASTPSN